MSLNTNAALNALYDLLNNNGVTYSDNAAINAIVSLIQANAGLPATFGNLVVVTQASDFGTAASKVITLASDTTYLVAGHIDLNGDRLVTSGNTTIVGGSSETSSITSTGLSGSALITSTYTLAMQFLTIKNVPIGISVTGNSGVALDWTGVNFENVTQVGTINGCGNFIFTKGSFLNSQSLTFTGTIGTIAFESSLLSSANLGVSVLVLDKYCVITRRFRIIYSSFVVPALNIGISVDAAATIPTESYILDTVNFSGAGSYLAGVTQTSNKALFLNCVGITNTAVNGQMYMQNNATATTVAAKDVFYKAAGTTTASADNAKYAHTSNRLTNQATVIRKYRVSCSLSFNSGNNEVCEFGFYDSTLGTVRTPSRTKSTANTAGRAESVTLDCVITHSNGDYIELWVCNRSAATNITVTDMNLVITEIK